MFQSIKNSFYNLYKYSPLCKDDNLTKYSFILKYGDDLSIIDENEYEKLKKIKQSIKIRIIINFLRKSKKKKYIVFKKLKKKLKRKKKKRKKKYYI